MGQTIANFDAMLKEHYMDKVPELVNQKIAVHEHFSKRSGAEFSADGRQVTYPMHVGRNSGVGAIGERGQLPTAGAQQYVSVSIPFRFNYGRIEITSQAMKQSMTSKGAFRKAIDEEITRAGKDVGREKNRQLWGFGQGTLAFVNHAAGGGIITASATATVEVDAPGGVAGADNGTRFIRKGDILAFITGGAIESYGTVVSITSSSAMVVNLAQNVSDNAKIVRLSSITAPALIDCAYNNEPMGLLGMIDDGSFVATYMGVSRTAYPILKSNVVAASALDVSSYLTLGGIQAMYDLADQTGNGTIKTMWCHHSVRREYLSQLQTFRRYNDANAKSPDGGFKGSALEADITFSEKPMKVDRDCPYGMLFGIDDSSMFRYVLAEGEWADDDGKILLRVAGQDAYEARFRVFDNYMCDRPNTCFAIKGIALRAGNTLETVPGL